MIALSYLITLAIGLCLGMILNAPAGYEDPERGFVFGEPEYDEVRGRLEREC